MKTKTETDEPFEKIKSSVGQEVKPSRFLREAGGSIPLRMTIK